MTPPWAMPTYERRHPLDVPADRAFTILSDPTGLPRYFTRLTRVRPEDGDRIETSAVIDTGDGSGEQEVTSEAWFRQDASARELSWGAPGANDYHGTMRIEPDGDAASTVVLSISSETDHDGVAGEIDATLERLTTFVTQDS